MQRVRIIGVIWLIAMAGGCGNGDEGPAGGSTEAALFVGQWSYRPGAVNRMTCGSQTRETVLNGTETLQLGSSAALEWVSGSLGCRFDLTIDGDTARVVPGQSCHVAAGANSGTLEVKSASFTLSASTRTMVASGSAAARYDDGRTPCTAVFSGTLVLP